MGLVIPSLITEETGLERAERYLSAIQIVQSLDQQQWEEFEGFYGTKDTISDKAKEKR